MSSSISSSDGARSLLWGALWLVCFDLVLGRLFPPASLQATDWRGKVGSYLSYGLSTEARIRLYAGPPADETARPGWLDPLSWVGSREGTDRVESRTVTFYGNSFIRQVAEEIERRIPDLRVRVIVAPAAPPSHSYAAFLMDREQIHSDLAVIGVLDDTLPGMLAMTRATQSVVQPNPYTYPRYRVVDGTLVSEQPVVRTLGDLQKAMAEGRLWKRYQEQLRSHDDFYREIVFEAGVLDVSVLARLLRAAWAVRMQRTQWATLEGSDGEATPDAEAAIVTRAALLDFAQKVRADGGAPLVVGISTPRHGTALRSLLDWGEAGERPPTFFTDSECPAGNLSSFAGDGHFSGECVRRIAVALEGFVRDG